MPRQQNIYQQLLQKGFSKRDIHSALHKAIMLQIKYDRAIKKSPSALHFKHSAFRFQLSAFFKDSHFLKNLISAVISFIKTQFAKKPKNPV